MERYQYTVKSELGMHARPAGMFVKLAGQYHATIEVHKGEKAVNVRRILAVMGMGIRQGDEICFTAEGEDEVAVMAEIRTICEEIL